MKKPSSTTRPVDPFVPAESPLAKTFSSPEIGAEIRRVRQAELEERDRQKERELVERRRVLQGD